MESEELIFQLSEDNEQIVRSYKCIKLSRWFSEPTFGYLTVTNKRLVFHSTSRTLTGRSLLINEMPLGDVAGLSIYQGLSLSWLRYLLFVAAAYIATQAVVLLLPDFFISYWAVALLAIPFAVTWLLSSNIFSEQLKEKIYDTLDNLLQNRIKVSRDPSSYLRYTRIPLYLGLAILGWRLAFTTNFGLGTPILAWASLLAIYFFIFLNYAGRRSSFSLHVGSKTLQDTGIFIPGDSFQLLPGRETTAVQGVGASPAEDASRVLRELGAMLLDMQLLGDLGIQKWQT